MKQLDDYGLDFGSAAADPGFPYRFRQICRCREFGWFRGGFSPNPPKEGVGSAS